MKYILTLILLLCIAAVGVGSYVYFSRDKLTKSGKSVDTAALFIGTWRDNELGEANWMHITIQNNRSTIYNNSVNTHEDLFTHSAFEGLVFVDLADVIRRYTSDVAEWAKSDTNAIYVRVENTINSFFSAPVKLDNSGIWCINVPVTQYEQVEVVHSAVTIEVEYVK